MNSATKPQTLTLPDFNAIFTAELAGLGGYGRITITTDFCGNKLARYTVTRERSVKAVSNGDE
jgi:hypothetical protein